ncbi:hypothetical protein Mgra_00010004 [Meloidogyne graminicola]|uniref:RanBP2-type domain-containing protein n=1 Tax=Meloidogyne graminicola TaxID=189291 RepID=A0A8S9ZD46_9BILA|nr:hypothetical protein Mgra_00010004 [Meloidogyne graminicola]
MAESSSKDSAAPKKWACNYCTFLNWDASIKCVLCYQPRNKPILIEELCPTNESLVRTSILHDEQLRWPCPTCNENMIKIYFRVDFMRKRTYLNCQRTKRCIQCTTDRPLRYASPPFVSNPVIPVKHSNTQNQQHKDNNSISRALNKWTCQSWLTTQFPIILFLSTFDNWPKATKCTLCGQKRLLSRVQSLSPPQESDVQNVHRKRNSGEAQHQDAERTESRGDIDLELLNQLTIGTPRLGNRPDHNKDRHGSKRSEQ